MKLYLQNCARLNPTSAAGHATLPCVVRPLLAFCAIGLLCETCASLFVHKRAPPETACVIGKIDPPRALFDICKTKIYPTLTR